MANMPCRDLPEAAARYGGPNPLQRRIRPRCSRNVNEQVSVAYTTSSSAFNLGEGRVYTQLLTRKRSVRRLPVRSETKFAPAAAPERARVDAGVIIVRCLPTRLRDAREAPP